MADIEAVEVLQQAKDRILESGWGRGTCETRALRGERTDTYCLEEGILGEHGGFVQHSGNAAQKRAADYIKTAVGYRYSSPWWWNDNQKSEGVIHDAIDAAMLVAKEAPNPYSEI